MTDFCSNEEWLAAYLDKRLTERERFLYEMHLSGCSRCLAELMAVKSDMDEMSQSTALSREITVGLQERADASGYSWLNPLIAGLARLRGLSVQAANSAAFAAAAVLVLGFFWILASPDWDPDYRSGRAGIRRILSTVELGELRISSGRKIPTRKTGTIRGIDIPDRKLLENTQLSLNKIMSKYSQDPEIYTLLGHIYLAKNLSARAEVSYNMARLLNPKDAKTFNNLAVAAYRRGDIETSLDYLKEAIHRDDVPIEAYYNLGILYHETGNEIEMKRFLKLYLEKDPASPWAEKARSLLED